MANKVGIDIGATKIRMGVVRDSKIINEIKFPTSSNGSKEEIIEEIIFHIESLCGNNFSGIGIGVPGLVDEEKGIVYDLWNIPSWKEVHLQKNLEIYFKKPVSITNDANTFVLGEKMYGRGKTFKNIVGVTLGTGFGTGIIINELLYSGKLSSAGELGSLPYLGETIEDYCSGKFFRKQFNLDGEDVLRLANQGNIEAVNCFKEYGTHLGNALEIIVNVLSPEAIFLGGSIASSFKLFEPTLKQKIANFSLRRVSSQLVVEPSQIPNISILGAAALVKDKTAQEIW